MDNIDTLVEEKLDEQKGQAKSVKLPENMTLKNTVDVVELIATEIFAGPKPGKASVKGAYWLLVASYGSESKAD